MSKIEETVLSVMREKTLVAEVADKKDAYQIHGKLYLCAIREFHITW